MAIGAKQEGRSSLSWLIIERFRPNVATAIAAGSFCWLAIFVILWLGLFNMNLATLPIVVIALSFSWVELVIASFIVRIYVVPNDEL